MLARPVPELVRRPDETQLTAAPRVTVDPRESIFGILMAPSREGRWFAPVAGKTRLMKEIFLLQRETTAGARGSFDFQFVAGKYGPFSLQVYQQLDQMVGTGLVADVRKERVGLRGLVLSDEGRYLAIRAWRAKFDEELQAAFFSVKSNYNEWSLNSLLAYVYSSYPELTGNSVIKEEVLGYDP